jgi:hypothetical protein
MSVASGGSSAMFRDGLYKIAYPVFAQSLRELEEAVAVVSRGRVFASDRHGGVYRGAGVPTADGRGLQVEMTATVPADGELATGFEGGRYGALAAISGYVDPAAPSQHAIVQISGMPIEIEISYIGPLPS